MSDDAPVHVINVPTAPVRTGGDRRDNRHLDEKLAIRRYFLDKYPAPDGTFRVIDCCAGERQEIWSRLREQYQTRYLGLDKKKVGGPILKMDAVRWLAQTEWEADVIDIDTYGEPWDIYETALENFVGGDVTIFLTCCTVPVNSAVGKMSGAVKRRIGLPEDWAIWHPPALKPITLPAMLSLCLDRGFEVVEAARIWFIDGPGVRKDSNLLYLYMGLRLRWLT